MVQFVDFEPSKPRFNRADVERQLQEKPGVWAVIDTLESKLAASYASVWRGSRRHGGFEYAVRSCGRGTGRSHLMGRFTPPGDD